MQARGAWTTVVALIVCGMSACSSSRRDASATGASSPTQPPATAATKPAVPAGATVDPDGFVRMPGEASRRDTVYVVTGDVCEQFTPAYMQGLSGKKILRASAGVAGTSVCQYFISAENKNLMFQVAVDWRNVEDQKTAFRYLGWKITAEPSIPMNNFVVYQENGRINKVYLVFGPGKFVTLDRSAADALSESETMDLAVRLGGKLKDFK